MTFSTAHQQDSTRTAWLSAAVLFLVALGLRLHRLFDLDIWYDESIMLIQIQHSFAGIWNYCKLDNFPPLYSWLLKVWNLFFPGENSSRLFTALLGSATAPAAFYLGKVMLDRRLAWALSIACVLSPSLLYQHQIIRMYSLFTLFSCLSIAAFIRALQTDRWKYWMLMAMANLLGFYTFLFMAFLMATEGLLLLWFNRLSWQKYLRPFWAHLAPVLLMLIWAIFAVRRAAEVRADFLTGPFSQNDLARLWVFFGTGVDFSNRYLLTLLLNLPFLFGLTLCFGQLRGRLSLQVSAVLLVLPILMLLAIALTGPSLFMKRYFIFLLPLYLGLALAGWISLPSRMLRRLGTAILLLLEVVSAASYFGNYYDEHAEYIFIKHHGSREYDGHATTRMAALIRSRIEPNEVIVHFGSSMLRSFSFMPMTYYHRRALPEYLYSKQEVQPYFGGRYLQAGDQIGSLHELVPAPRGVWLVTLDSTEVFSDDSTRLGKTVHEKWLSRENFPLELQRANYAPVDTFRFGAITAIHYRRAEALILKPVHS